MSNEQQRDAAAVRIFPPAVPVITILLGVVLDLAWPLAIELRIPAPLRYWIGGAIAAGAFLGLGAWAVIVMRRAGQTVNPWKPTEDILAHGPYRFTRNPMYLQMVIICVGFAVLLANIWILILLPLCVYVLQQFAILPEEAYLERKFGETYLGYKQKVRRWL